MPAKGFLLLVRRMGIEISTRNILTRAKKLCLESLVLQNVNRQFEKNKQSFLCQRVILLGGPEKRCMYFVRPVLKSIFSAGETVNEVNQGSKTDRWAFSRNLVQ